MEHPPSVPKSNDAWPEFPTADVPPPALPLVTPSEVYALNEEYSARMMEDPEYWEKALAAKCRVRFVM